MSFPIVSTTTSDNYKLHALHLDHSNSHVFLHVHGTGANFYYYTWLEEVSAKLRELDWSYLGTNNRGAEIYDYWVDSPTKGAAHELFEDSVRDIDAWIKYALGIGYKKITLSGHSLGSEKVTYYMSHGQYKDEVSAVTLLGFSDSYGTNELYAKEKISSYLDEAHHMIAQGRDDQLLSNLLVHAGYLPQTAASYLNFFNKDSELSKALPLRQGKNLSLYRFIKVPILAVIGEIGEFTIIPISDAIKLLQNENPNTQVFQIKNSDHEYRGHELELANIIASFIESIKLSK